MTQNPDLMGNPFAFVAFILKRVWDPLGIKIYHVLEPSMTILNQ